MRTCDGICIDRLGFRVHGNGLALLGNALRVVRRLRPADAIAAHFLGAQLLDDGRAHHLGDDVELAVLQVVVDDEAHERLPVHEQAVFRRARGEVGFGFTGERGIVPEQTLVVLRVHQHGVESRGVFAAGADHLLAAHGLFGAFGNLHGRDRGVEHLVGSALETVFHLPFESREETHGITSIEQHFTSA